MMNCAQFFMQMRHIFLEQYDARLQGTMDQDIKKEMTVCRIKKIMI